MEIKLNVRAAGLLSMALDLYSRIGIGQLLIVEENVRSELFAGPDGAADRFVEAMQLVQFRTGQPLNGSFGIGHRSVAVDAKRAWEIKKVLDLALVQERGDPADRYTVRADGLSMRYTADTAPSAEHEPGFVTLILDEVQHAVAVAAFDVYSRTRAGDIGYLEELAVGGVVVRRIDELGGSASAVPFEGAALADFRHAIVMAQRVLDLANVMPDDPGQDMAEIAMALEAARRPAADLRG